MNKFQPSCASLNWCNGLIVEQAADAKQKLWYVFDHTLVLPEYLVDFEIVNDNSGSIKQLLTSTTSETPNEAVTESIPADVR